MTFEQFKKLSVFPNKVVLWGGKQMKLSSIDRKTKTCYLRKLNSWHNPYPVSYESVQLTD